jgi:hypothetical protein
MNVGATIVKMMTPCELYALRTTNLLPIPAAVMDTIASMQLVPVAQVYSKKPTGYKKPFIASNSWRTETIAMLKKTEFKSGDDPEFDTIRGIMNKIAASTVGKGTAEILEIIKKRDQVFRLRVVALMFDRGVSMPFFSKLIANVFDILFKDLPALKDDLQFSCSAEAFDKMFDQGATLVCPSSEQPDYDNKLCEFMKMKELRRGFAMFVTELHIRGLVDEEVIAHSVKAASDDMASLVSKPDDKTIIENVDQMVTLLFETCKVIATRYGKEHMIVKLIQQKARDIIAMPKTTTPCLGMRSRFKLEDTIKL